MHTLMLRDDSRRPSQGKSTAIQEFHETRVIVGRRRDDFLSLPDFSPVVAYRPHAAAVRRGLTLHVLGRPRFG
jgi:hypothetical protein